MHELTIKSGKANIYAKVARFAIGIIGIGYLSTGIIEYFSGAELTVQAVTNGILGLVVIIFALINNTSWANVEITLTDDFLRSTEDLSLIRTAYWNKLGSVVLTKFGIRLTYESGASERFRLPYLKKEEFTDLKQHLQSMSDEYHFSFREKPWWNLW